MSNQAKHIHIHIGTLVDKVGISTSQDSEAEVREIVTNALIRAMEDAESMLEPQPKPTQSKYVNPSLKITVVFDPDGDDHNSSMANAKIEPSLNVTGIQSLADIEVVKAVLAGIAKL